MAESQDHAVVRVVVFFALQINSAIYTCSRNTVVNIQSASKTFIKVVLKQILRTTLINFFALQMLTSIDTSST